MAPTHRKARGLGEVPRVLGHQVPCVQQVLKLAPDVWQLV